jgi:hypothetical protein
MLILCLKTEPEILAVVLHDIVEGPTLTAQNSSGAKYFGEVLHAIYCLIQYDGENYDQGFFGVVPS